jgi:hypothetical protein
VAGLGLAVVFGTLLGMAMGFSRVARDALYPLLVGFNAIPKATLVPVIALMFIGQHDFNTVLMAFLISFFPIAVSVGIGLSTLEPEYRDILRGGGGGGGGGGVAGGVLRGAEGLGHAGLHRHQPGRDRLPPRPRPRRAVQVGRDERRLPPDVRRADRPRLPGDRSLLRRGPAGAHLCGLGGEGTGVTSVERMKTRTNWRERENHCKPVYHTKEQFVSAASEGLFEIIAYRHAFDPNHPGSSPPFSPSIKVLSIHASSLCPFLFTKLLR